MNFTDTPWWLSLGQGAAMIGLFIVVFLVAKWLKEVATDYDIKEQLIQHDNPAVAITIAGYYLGVVLVFAGAYLGPSRGVLWDLITVGGYSLLGIFLLNIARFINDRLILRHFSVRKELLEDRNPGAGIVLFASYVASGLVVAGAVYGEGGGLLTTLVFFALGQLALLLFTGLYDLTIPYSLHAELEADNVAAGIGFGGALIAIGMIVMNAVSGNFISWTDSLQSLGLQVLAIFIYLLLVRLFFDKVLLPGNELNREIATDRNLGAGILEFAVSVGFSAILVLVV